MAEQQDPQFTLSIVTGPEANDLVRLTMVVARHRIGIVSMTSIADESARASRHILLVRAAPDRVRRAMKQIGAAVGVLSADCYAEGETIDREVALFKLTGGSPDKGDSEHELGDLVRGRRARVLIRSRDAIVIEKTGSLREIEELYELLRPFGVIEFVRSGRVIVTGARPGSGIPANGG
jgi:acetolactate synthase-1/3 small subunit